MDLLYDERIEQFLRLSVDCHIPLVILSRLLHYPLPHVPSPTAKQV